jgi:IS5 family transposase
MEQMPYRLDWLWFCGYDLDEEVPNHSVLSKARRRWGRDVFVRLFQQVLRQCVEGGLVDGRLVHVDSSVIRADASMDTLQPDLRVVSETLYCDLEQSAEEFSESEPDRSPPGGTMISPTDPDARMTRKNGKTMLGYKEHRVVDDAHGIITATATTDASVDESHMLTEVLDQHRFNSGGVERLNGTIRTQQARLTQRTPNGSRLAEMLQWALWLWRDLYNWVRPHGSLEGRRHGPRDVDRGSVRRAAGSCWPLAALRAGRSPRNRLRIRT